MHCPTTDGTTRRYLFPFLVLSGGGLIVDSDKGAVGLFMQQLCGWCGKGQEDGLLGFGLA